jgi:pimeloyl-ACP methyl ester carboxylesterase
MSGPGARWRWRWRALSALALAGILLLGGLLLLAPGYARLALMQPARDVLFFERELKPFSHYNEIERHNPQPSETIILAASGEASGDVDLALDLWRPADSPAPVVLLLHGSSPRGRTLGFNMFLAERLRDAGWLVLTPDARGFGDTGSPQDKNHPEAWFVTRDLQRLVDYAVQHPLGNGKVVAVGHSLGGSHLLTLDAAANHLAAIALIGPGRHSSEELPSWWQRVRFSSDRVIPGVLPPEVTATESQRHDILKLPPETLATVFNRPVLLMDGEREGERLIAVLREAAVQLGPAATHLTIRGSHHYCGAYQLPWPARTVYVRPEIFQSCLEPLHGFLADAITQSPGNALPHYD